MKKNNHHKLIAVALALLCTTTSGSIPKVRAAGPCGPCTITIVSDLTSDYDVSGITSGDLGTFNGTTTITVDPTDTFTIQSPLQNLLVGPIGGPPPVSRGSSVTFSVDAATGAVTPDAANTLTTEGYVFPDGEDGSGNPQLHIKGATVNIAVNGLSGVWSLDTTGLGKLGGGPLPGFTGDQTVYLWPGWHEFSYGISSLLEGARIGTSSPYHYLFKVSGETGTVTVDSTITSLAAGSAGSGTAPNVSGSLTLNPVTINVNGAGIYGGWGLFNALDGATGNQTIKVLPTVYILTNGSSSSLFLYKFNIYTFTVDGSGNITIQNIPPSIANASGNTLNLIGLSIDFTIPTEFGDWTLDDPSLPALNGTQTLNLIPGGHQLLAVGDTKGAIFLLDDSGNISTAKGTTQYHGYYLLPGASKLLLSTLPCAANSQCLAATVNGFLELNNSPTDFSFPEATAGEESDEFSANAPFVGNNQITVYDDRNSGGFSLQLSADTKFANITNPGYTIPLNNLYAATSVPAEGTVDPNGISCSGVQYRGGIYDTFTDCSSFTKDISAPLNTTGSVTDPATFTSLSGNTLDIPGGIDVMSTTAGHNGSFSEFLDYYLKIPKELAAGTYQVTLTFTLF